MVNYNSNERSREVLPLIAKIVRIITIPPVLAAALVNVLFSLRMIKFPEAAVIFFAAVVLPVLPYSVFREREKQRHFGFVFSGIGYIIALIIALSFGFSPVAKFMVTTYLVSWFYLILTERFVGIRSSAHACGTVGPMVMLIYLLGFGAVIPAIAVIVLSFAASLILERHTVGELLVGSMSSLCAMALSFVIFRI